jgi:uncharacterized membrane protein YraQ (UPF0718 family)
MQLWICLELDCVHEESAPVKERTKFLLIVLTFLTCYYVPWDHATIGQSGQEAFMMLQDYARKHVLTCLIPAFFIAGAIAVFVSQAAILKYFGATAKKIVSYSVASVSGTILAVCSCTVLPLFAGIYARGAGIGPATAFLYSGPAINVLAIVLTARILGWQLGLARAVGAVLFAVVAGLLMALIFHKDDAARVAGKIYLPEEETQQRTLFQDGVFMLTMILITSTRLRWPVVRTLRCQVVHHRRPFDCPRAAAQSLVQKR